MRIRLTLLFAVILWNDIGSFGLLTAADQESTGKKYAILVGVKEYDRNQLKNLPFAENDVSEMAEILKQSGFRRVELLTQAEGAKKARFLPLAKTIRETIAGVFEDRESDDLVLIAFAGHGVQFKGEKENYFCPMDAVLTDRSTLMSLTDVYEQLKQSKAGAKLLMVDACRNDPLAGNARAAGEVTLQSLTTTSTTRSSWRRGRILQLFSRPTGVRRRRPEARCLLSSCDSGPERRSQAKKAGRSDLG